MMTMCLSHYLPHSNTKSFATPSLLPPSLVGASSLEFDPPAPLIEFDLQLMLLCRVPQRRTSERRQDSRGE
ncbi:unnamed protein product, partial [Mesorhabditis spiculigera]